MERAGCCLSRLKTDTLCVCSPTHHPLLLLVPFALAAAPQVRVELAGGFIWWNRVMGELAISRAIGDHKLRPYVIADPEVGERGLRV
jgi:hypothetical protein